MLGVWGLDKNLDRLHSYSELEHIIGNKTRPLNFCLSQLESRNSLYEK